MNDWRKDTAEAAFKLDNAIVGGKSTLSDSVSTYLKRV